MANAIFHFTVIIIRIFLFSESVQSLVPAIIPPFTPFYWPCVSPPTSPCMHPLQSQPGLVLVTGLCPNISPQDILAYFQTNPEVNFPFFYHFSCFRIAMKAYERLNVRICITNKPLP